MTALAEFAMLSYGWRRLLLMVAAGAVAGLSVAPLFLLPALFIAIPIWIWALDGAELLPRLRRFFGAAFTIGWGFGLGYFLVALHWVGAAFFIDGGPLMILAPVAVIVLAGGLAVFWGLASAAAHLSWTHGALRLVTLAATLTAAEFLRSNVLSGFPFDLPGYALTANDQMAQAASLIGVYGLSFVAIAMAGIGALVWPGGGRGWTARLAPVFAVLALIALQLGYGNWRLGSTAVAERTDMRVRLVQPAIPQDEKWEAANREVTVQRLLDLSQSRLAPDAPGLDAVTHLIWPESALPFFLADYPEALARLARLIPDGTLLITGAPREDYVPGEGAEADADRGPGYNAILAIDSGGEVVASYDKIHLVPFGEYFPFQEQLAGFGIRQLVNGSNGWLAGADPRRVLSLPGTPPLVPLICYEAVFPGEVGRVAQSGAIILNVTNDAWFDGTIGPAQHFHHARLRAVEQGLPLIRVGNTGVTAIVDPLGRVTARLAEQDMGVLDVVPALPVARPLYAQIGEWPVLGAIALCIFVSVIAARRQPRLRLDELPAG